MLFAFEFFSLFLFPKLFHSVRLAPLQGLSLCLPLLGRPDRLYA